MHVNEKKCIRLHTFRFLEDAKERSAPLHALSKNISAATQVPQLYSGNLRRDAGDLARQPGSTRKTEIHAEELVTYFRTRDKDLFDTKLNKKRLNDIQSDGVYLQDPLAGFFSEKAMRSAQRVYTLLAFDEKNKPWEVSVRIKPR